MFFIFIFYVFLLPLEYLQEKIPKGGTAVNYANFMMLIMTLGVIFQRLRRGRRIIVRSPLNLPLVLFLVWTFFGVVWGTLSQAEVLFETSSKFFLQFANGLLMFWFAINLVDSRKRVRWVIFAMALVAPLVFRVFYSQLHSILVWHYRDDLRINGPFVNVGSNELGAFFLYSALFFFLYAFWRHRLWQRFVLFGAAAMYIYGILYSYSRASQLSFVVALGVMASLRYRFVLVLIAVAWFTMPYWVPPSVQDRWDMTTDESGQLESSAASRSEFWKVAWTIFLEHPITGSGVGTFKILNPAHMDAHNIYLRVLAEQGAIGLALLLAIWFTILRMSVQLWRRSPHSHDRHAGHCLVVATIGLMLANVFGDRFSHFVMIGHFWVLVGLMARLHAQMWGVEALDDAATDPGDEAPQGAPEIDVAHPSPPPAGAFLQPSLVLTGPKTGEKPIRGRQTPPTLNLRQGPKHATGFGADKGRFSIKPGEPTTPALPPTVKVVKPPEPMAPPRSAPLPPGQHPGGAKPTPRIVGRGEQK